MEIKNLTRAAETADELPRLEKARKMLSKPGDTMRWLRQLRSGYIDKRWQGGTRPGNLDGDIQRITRKQRLPPAL